MKVLAIYSKIPIFPATGGNRERILTMLRALRAQGWDIRFVLIQSRMMKDFDEAAHRDLLGDDFHILRASFWEQLASDLQSVVQLKLLPTLRRLLGNPEAKQTNVDFNLPKFVCRHAREALDNETPDAVLVQYVHFSAILDLFPESVFKIIDTHDSFAHQFTPDAEARGLARADAVIAIQQAEAERFRHIIDALAKRPATTVHTVSHLIAQPRAVSVAQSNKAIFLGSDFEANRRSRDWLLEDVLPLVREKNPDFVLDIVGTIGNGVQPAPNLRIRGRLDDLDGALAEAPVLANAITAGTGIKIKLLDAMRAGLPIVSTEKGVEGIDPRYLKGVTVTPDGDAQAFADALVALTSDKAGRETQSAETIAAASIWKKDQELALEKLMESATDRMRT